MRRIAIATVLALTASPALACGPGSPQTASGLVLKHTKPAEPSKAELRQRAAAAKAQEAAMLKQGYVKAYTRCGSGSFIWVKKDSFPRKPAT